MQRSLPPLAAAILAAGCGVYLFASGGRLGMPALFLVAAAATLVLTVWLFYRVGRALVEEPRAEEVEAATGRRRKELEHEKQGLLKAIKDLEFDHAMKKISDHDFAEIAAAYRARALRIMSQLDETP